MRAVSVVEHRLSNTGALGDLRCSLQLALNFVNTCGIYAMSRWLEIVPSHGIKEATVAFDAPLGNGVDGKTG